MKGRVGRIVVLVLFILLSISMIGNVLRFDFGIGTVKAAPIFSDGFESGDFSAWSGTSTEPGGIVEVVSSPVYQGNYSAHLSNGAVDTTPYVWKNFASMNTAYARVYVNFYNLSFGYNPSRQTRAIFFVFGMSEYLAYASEVSVYNDNGNYVWALRVMDDNGTQYFVTSSQTVSTNTWYCVEVKRVADSSLGETRLYIDGTETLNVTGLDNAVTGQSDYFLLDGETYGQVSLTNNYFDCAVIDTSYIGPLDTTPPTFGNVNTSTTVAGTPCSFNCLISDDTNVSTYIFSTNNTGTWVNDTAASFSSFYNSTAAWANVTKTLDNTAGDVVSYMWYANDTSNNWGSSDQYNLTVTAPLTISIVSPENTTYTTANVSLNFTINEAVSWMGYSLDGQGNVTITGNVTLIGLSNGSHQVIVYANDTVGNMGSSQTVYFTVESTEQITIDSNPEGLGLVNVDGTNYTTPQTFTWTVGDTHTLEAFSPVAGSAGTQYVFADWSDGGSQTHVFTVPAYTETVTANYNTQFQITFNQTGVGADFTGTVVTIDGINYGLANLPTSFFWNIGSPHTFAFASPLVVNASRQYTWASTSGLSTLQSGTLSITGSGSITGNFITPPAPDVAVTGIAFSKTVVGRGYSMNVTVTAANLGGTAETFNLTLYANTTIVASQNVTLQAGTSANFTFSYTVNLAYGNYTISAYAWPVPGETNTANNNFTGRWIIVSIPCDIIGPNGWPDGIVNMRDIAIAARAFGSTPGSSNWNPNADFNNDGTIDMKDIALVARNFGQHT